MRKEEAKHKIAELVEKYRALSAKEVRAFNEANTKQAFILPMFEALGWDIYDTTEVALEETASNGRVDFAFKINGVAKFYTEAKKLGADLNNPIFVKQAVTYAYSNSVTWAVLTNFTEIHLLNAQKSLPFITLKYEDYINSFDKLWLISRESLTSNLLNKEAAQYGAIPPLIPIEEKLFKQLRQWRETLYNELLHFNEWLKPEQRDEVIEKLFNRLIFIRTAEDRNLEEHKLRSAVNRWRSGGHKKDELTAALRKVFEYYNGYYDSDLFKQHLPDDDRLSIDEYIIADILNGLYDIPGGMASYDFSLIDADVLGRVYEQYLGYVSKYIIAKAKEAQARMALGYTADTDYKLVEKEKHRKEQGIYYTPKFVTDYIVKETVGRFIKENEHANYNKILNMKILDPACGSGSFLIRAYDELLNYHAKVHSKATTELDQFDRMPILTGNIFGVDLDQQAVEFACLNLLLRGLAKRDHLPPLTNNIKQGNSLISGTEEELKKYFGDDWEEKKRFNWEQEFKDIMANGGFDVVIGNPPYGRIKQIKDKEEKKALSKYFDGTYSYQWGNLNYYKLFLERAFSLVKNGGYFGMIFPTAFLGEDSSKVLRKLFFEDAMVSRILQFPEKTKVFGEVTQDVIIFVYQKAKVDADYSFAIRTNIGAEEVKKLDESKAITLKRSEIKELTGKDYQIPIFTLPEKEWTILKKISKCPPFRGERDIPPIGIIGVGHLDETFDKDFMSKETTGDILVKGIHLNRYAIDLDPKGLQPRWVRKKEFLKRKPLAKENVDQERIVGRNTLNRAIRPRLLFAILPEGFVITNAIKYIVLEPKNKLHKNYIVGLLNSSFLNWRFELFSGQNNIRNYEIEALPICRIDFDNPKEKKRHGDLVALVERMLELNKRLAPVRDTYGYEREELLREIERTDKEIDDLVYDLYGLTEEERKIVGG